mgnify:CR=1 FL=1
MPKIQFEFDIDLNEYLDDEDQVRADVQAEVVRSIARQVHLPWLTSEADRNKLREEVQGQIRGIVTGIVTEQVRSIATGEFRPTDRWGDPKGEPVTLREMCARQAQGWLTEQCDSSGCAGSNVYSAKRPRIEWMVRKEVDAVFSSELAAYMAAVKVEIRDSLKARIQGALADEVVKLLAPKVA